MANAGSVLGGAGSGAATGAVIGSVVPGIGTAVGAVAGGLLGGIGGYFSSDAEEEALKAQQRAIEEQRRIYEQNFQTAKGYYEPYSLAGNRALSQYENFDPTLRMEDFSFSGQVSDYLDPSIAYQQEQARKQLEASASAQGGLYSGAQMKALQDRAQNIGQMGYQQAFQNMQGDKAFNYQAYRDKWANERDNINNRMSQIKSILDIGANASGQIAQMRMGLSQPMANLANQTGQIQGLQNSMGSRAISDSIGNIMSNAPQMYGAYQQGVTNNLQNQYLQKQIERG